MRPVPPDRSGNPVAEPDFHALNRNFADAAFIVTENQGYETATYSGYGSNGNAGRSRICLECALPLKTSGAESSCSCLNHDEKNVDFSESIEAGLLLTGFIALAGFCALGGFWF